MGFGLCCEKDVSPEIAFPSRKKKSNLYVLKASSNTVSFLLLFFWVFFFFIALLWQTMSGGQVFLKTVSIFSFKVLSLEWKAVSGNDSQMVLICEIPDMTPVASG